MMFSNQQVKIVRYKQIATKQDCFNALPDRVTAVYAWFRDLTLSEEDLASEDKFVNTIMQWLEDPLPLSENQKVDISLFYKLGITIKSEKLRKKKERSLRQYAKKENIRKEIGRTLEAVTFLQAPLYIGKASDRLAERVWEHVNRDTDLWNRLEKAGLSLQDCLLVYVPISNSNDIDADLTPLVQVVEDIITKLSRPGFVRRSG